MIAERHAAELGRIHRRGDKVFSQVLDESGDEIAKLEVQRPVHRRSKPVRLSRREAEVTSERAAGAARERIGHRHFPGVVDVHVRSAAGGAPVGVQLEPRQARTKIRGNLRHGQALDRWAVEEQAPLESREEMAERAASRIEADGDRAACDLDARRCRCRQSNRRERRRQIHRQRRADCGNERRLRGETDRWAKRAEIDVHALERNSGARRAELEVQRDAAGG